MTYDNVIKTLSIANNLYVHIVISAFHALIFIHLCIWYTLFSVDFQYVANNHLRVMILEFLFCSDEQFDLNRLKFDQLPIKARWNSLHLVPPHPYVSSTLSHYYHIISAYVDNRTLRPPFSLYLERFIYARR